MISSSVQPKSTAHRQNTSAAETRRLPHHHVHHLSFSSPSHHHHHRHSHRLQIRAIDAAQPYDYESHLNNSFTQSTKLKIAIIGYGNFGQFLSRTFIRHGHTVYAYSRSSHHPIAQSIGATFFSDLQEMCEHHPDVILISTSIISTKIVLRSLPLESLRRNTLFVDVLSVKEFPKNLFLQILPSHFDILCTHPMFGPQSAKQNSNNLPFVFDKVRIGSDISRIARVEYFLDIFRKEGCRMVEMSCADHDKYAAISQLITHTIGRILQKLMLESTPINTKGYEALLELVENTASDSFDLYYGLFMYNENAMDVLDKLNLAVEAVKKDLFGRITRGFEEAVVFEGGGRIRRRKEIEDGLHFVSLQLVVNYFM